MNKLFVLTALLSFSSFAHTDLQTCQVGFVTLESYDLKDGRDMKLYENKAIEILKSKGYAFDHYRNANGERLQFIDFGFDLDYDMSHIPQQTTESTDPWYKKLSQEVRDEIGWWKAARSETTVLRLRTDSYIETESSTDWLSRIEGFHDTVLVKNGSKVSKTNDLKAIEALLQRLPDCKN